MEGAGYTDVHARLPALELLFFVSLAAAAILLYNIRRQGWTLPVLAVGVWAFVALVIGVIYPAVLQALKVNPAQSTLEQPYIQRNIAATRAAYGLDNVKVAQLRRQHHALSRARWRPTRRRSPTSGSGTPTRPSRSRPSRSCRTSGPTTRSSRVGVDRYKVDGKLTPAVVGVRQMNPQDLPSVGWVNTHLAVHPRRGRGAGRGQPGDVERQPGLRHPGRAAQSVARAAPRSPSRASTSASTTPATWSPTPARPSSTTRRANGTTSTTHYAGTGGVKLSSFFTKAAFAVRLGDLNLLISNLITPQSQDHVRARHPGRWPRRRRRSCSFDADPYAAVVDGHIDWVLDAYTTTDQYPYSQNADSAAGAAGQRAAGQLQLRAQLGEGGHRRLLGQDDLLRHGPNDPILQAYEAAFPDMFTPGVADELGRCRPTCATPRTSSRSRPPCSAATTSPTPSDFYTAGDAWNLSPTAGAGLADKRPGRHRDHQRPGRS